MRVFVTGVSGFIGRRLCRRLVAAGDQVAGLVLPGDVESEVVDPSVRFYEGDLLDPASLAQAVGAFEPDVVLHLAGLSAVGVSWLKIPDYYQVNVVGTRNVLAAARDPSCRFVFASSGEVYGAVAEENLPMVETSPVRPPSPYALTKAASELMVLREGGTVVRSFNMVGPGQSEGFALPAFALQLAAIERGEQEPLLEVGNLEPRRDFVHVEDGASAYELLTRVAVPGEIYNLASGTSRSIGEMLDRLIEIVGFEVEIRQDPDRMRPVDVPTLSGDSSKLRSLGWRPTREIDDALRELWQSVKER